MREEDRKNMQRMFVRTEQLQPNNCDAEMQWSVIVGLDECKHR